MVHIVPPLAGAAPTGGVTPTPVGSSPAAPLPNDIEQFAAEGASLISDAPASPIVPPPLPADASRPVDLVAPVARPGVVIAAGAVAALLVIGAIAWAVALFLGNDSSPDIAASPDVPVHIEEQPRNDQPRSSDTVSVSVSPAAPISRTDEPAKTFPQASSASQPTDATPPADAANIRHSDTVVATPDDSGSPLAQPDARENPAGADKPPTDNHTVSKPALKLDELPKSEPADADPVAAQSAGLEAGQAAETEVAGDPPGQGEAAIEHAVAGESDDPAEPPLRRIAPNKVDVPTRLATPIATIQFRDAPLYKTVDTIADLAGVPIGLDVDALRAAGVRVERPMTFVAKSVAIGGALDEGLRPLGLKVREQNGILQVLPAGAGQTRKARYAVDDLVRSGDPPIDELVEIVRAVVAGPAVTEETNSFAVTAESGAVYLTAGEIEHDRMIELCEKLRVARGRPLRTRFDANRPDPRFDPRRFELATRRTKALDVLARPVTAGIGRPAPLSVVVNFLEKQTGATILVDQAALAAAGLAAGTDARLVADGEPLEAALGRLLEPLGLAFRVVDGKVLEITTSDALAEHVCIEFYPLRGLAGASAAAGGEMETFREKLLAAAAISDSKAAIEFDPSSECLIVCASYPTQVRLEQALRKLARP
jgi:hypothetical protein